MFDIKDFKVTLDAMIEVLEETSIHIGGDSLSSPYDTNIRVLLFKSRERYVTIVNIRDDESTEVNFTYDKTKKKYEVTVKTPAKYRPELEVMYLNELENVLKEANKKLGSEKKAYNTQIEKMYNKVVKELELKKKRETTCYIK